LDQLHLRAIAGAYRQVRSHHPKCQAKSLRGFTDSGGVRTAFAYALEFK